MLGYYANVNSHLADARHAGEHALAAVEVLHGSFAEEEEHVVLVLERMHEVGCCAEEGGLLVGQLLRLYINYQN